VERLAEVPPPAAPINLLTLGERARAEDPRVAGAVRRPAGLHALYRLIQSALEETPRSVPRVATSLVARARSAQTEWTLGVRSLSENGCLVEGPELPPLETALRLEIELPWGERLATPAVAAYEQGSGLGLVFHGITVAARRRIAKAVVSLLQRA
jgi:hypothetical protein